MKISMVKTGTRILLLLGIATSLAPSTARAISYSVDCYGTIEAWKSDPNYKSYAASCYCPSAHSHPVCGGGSSGSGGASGGGSSNDLSLMVAESFLTALLTPAPEPKGFSELPPPAVSPNPVYANAWKKLQEMRLPPDKAQFLLGEALRSQTQAVSGFKPGDSVRQLALAACLSQSAARTASLEEASWLVRQGSFALSGDLVEAVPGYCSPVPEPPGMNAPSAQGGPSLEDLGAVLDLLEKRREAALSAREDVREAQEAVRRWEEISRTLSAEADAAVDQQTKTEKKSALEEALKMLAESEKLEAEAERFTLESEKALQDAEISFRQGGLTGFGGIP